jgi:hypothetical protein
MKIRFIKSGKVADIVPDQNTWMWVEAGLIEHLKTEPNWRAKTNGTAKWFVSVPQYCESTTPCIVAHCDTCNAHQVFMEGPRPVHPKTGYIPPSTLPKAFLEHCSKKEMVPAEIIKEYEATFDANVMQ